MTGGARALLSHHPGPEQWGFACLSACLATPGWGDLGVAKPTGKQGSLATFSRSFHLYDSFHFWWLYRGTSEGLDGSLSVFPSHRKLDEEYKERIAALKNEFRKEREQILQQVGKQRLELEQEMTLKPRCFLRNKELIWLDEILGYFWRLFPLFLEPQTPF